MNHRKLLGTTAAILVFGLASVAGSQPDQRAPDADKDKHPAKEVQPRQQKSPNPARHRQPQPQSRPVAPDRRAQPTPVISHRQGPTPGQPQSQRPTAQRHQPQTFDRESQPRPAAAARSGQPSRAPQVPQVRTRNDEARVQLQTAWPRYRAQNWNSQHRTWRQRGGYRGYRIPSRQFSLYFGAPHRYHLSTFQIRFVAASPQFYADGFWFTILDPVPEYWSEDWYDADYVSIVEAEDGYYLVDDSYPNDMVSISVQLR